VQLDVRIPERREEPDPLHVIEVQVRQEEVDLLDRLGGGQVGGGPSPVRCGLVAGDVTSERADPGSRVEDDQRPVLQADLDAGRVAAVPNRVRTRRGE
jgi:hypothetical protein